MNNWLLIACFFVFFFQWNTLSAQSSANGSFDSPFFTNLTKNEGLNCKAATCINEDKKTGFIWIGTNDGLNRYDGKNILRFSHNQEDTNSIQANYINDILSKEDGSIWIASVGGLDHYQPQKNSFSHYRNQLKGYFVKSILEYKDQSIWVGTMNRDNFGGGGLHLLNPDKGSCQYWKLTDFINISKTDSAYHYKFNSISDIKLDAANPNFLWVSVEAGVALFDISQKKYTNFWKIPNLQLSKYQYVTCVLPDKDGSIWVGVWNGGLYHFFPKTDRWDYVEIKADIKDNFRIVSSLFAKNEEEILIGSQYGILTLQKPNRIVDFWEHNLVEKEESVVGYLTWNIMKDKNQTYWFAMENGVSRLDFRNNFTKYFKVNPQNKLNPNICKITAVAHNPKTEKVIVSVNAAENLYFIDFSNKTFQVVNYFPWKNKAKEPRYFEAITYDSSNQLWLLSQKQLFKMEASTNKIIPISEYNEVLKRMKTSDNYILKFQNKSLLWVAGKEDIFKIDLEHKAITQYNYENVQFLKLGDKVSDCIITQENSVLFSTSNGVLIFKENSWYHSLPFSNNREDGMNNIHSITQTTDGSIWLSVSNQGVIRCTYKDNKLIPEKNSIGQFFLIKESIYQIRSIKDQIWMATASGILNYDYGNKSLKRFSYQQGFSSSKIPILGESSLFVNSENNYLIFGAASGKVGVIDQEKFLKISDPKPNLYLSQFKVFDKPILENQNLNDISDIKLTYLENFFTLNFNAIQFSNNQDVDYSYILEGVNPQWVATNSPIASYTNIEGGTYKFRVKAKNRDGVWSDEKSILIHIKPPFWKTKWFFVFSLLGILLLTYAFYRYRIAQIQEKNRIQQLALQSEVKALRVQMNPHFIFNALNSVKNNILSNKPLEAAEYLSNFAYLLRNILQQSRLKLIPLNEELETLLLYIEMEMGRFQKKFVFNYTLDKDIPISEIMIPPLIIQPYVENAIRHAFNNMLEPGILNLEVKMEQPNIVLCFVDDNGCGRLVKETIDSKHKSLGMSITNDRIKLHNQLNEAHIKVNIIDKKNAENVPCGTRIEIRLTINN